MEAEMRGSTIVGLGYVIGAFVVAMLYLFGGC